MKAQVLQGQILYYLKKVKLKNYLPSISQINVTWNKEVEYKIWTIKSHSPREGHILSFVKEIMQVAETCCYRVSSYLHEQTNKKGRKGKKPHMCTD